MGEKDIGTVIQSDCWHSSEGLNCVRGASYWKIALHKKIEP